MARARSRHRWTALALGLVASLVVLGLELSRLLDPVEAVVTDLQMRLRGAEAPDPRVAIVAIDADSVEALGRWPWPRTCLAALIDRLGDAGARVIALDIVLSEPTRSPPGAVGVVGAVGGYGQVRGQRAGIAGRVGAALVLRSVEVSSMPATNPRISTVIDEDLAAWLRRRSEEEGKSVSLLVRDVLARFREEEEERYWAREGEERLATFDRRHAVRHEDVWG